MIADIIEPRLPPLAPEPQGLTGDGWVIYWIIVVVLIVALVTSMVAARRDHGRD